jgi:hypothetical protein
MSKLTVSRGNCPCLFGSPEDLAVGEDGYHCHVDEAACSAADLLEALPQAHGHHHPEPEAEADGPVVLRLSDLYGLYDADFGDRFLLVAPPGVRARILFAADAPVKVEELAWAGPETRTDLLAQLGQWRAQGLRASVLWIGADEFVHLPLADIEGVKLGAISYFSTGFSESSLRRYVRIIAGTDYRSELSIENDLISYLEGARALVLRTPELDTACVFEHQEALHWFSLHGPLRFGDQTVLPTGEMSALADASGDFDAGTRLRLNGEVVFKGSPIIHRGDRSVSLEHTSETYQRLAAMEDVPVVAHVRDGRIEEFTAPTPESRRLRDAFEGLVEAEPRYRKIHEFGFGTHKGCADRVPGNFHPNERWPGIHMGLGLGGYTPFHIDLALTEVQVFLDNADGMKPLYRSLGFDRV